MDHEDILPRKQKLSVKKAKKSGLFAGRETTITPTSTALVASVYGGSVSLFLRDQVREAIASPSILLDLVVGDAVEVDTNLDPPRILSRLPRRTELKRTRAEGGSRHHKQIQIIAANIDKAVIVATATQPAFEPELVDRYIILCRSSHIEPVICVNKADLTAERHPALNEYRKNGLSVIETSPKTGLGLDELRSVIRRTHTILLGKSGAGKSSLINAILPSANIKTQTMNERAQQGQHTTTRSDIHAWEADSYIIDTPGIRMLDISHLDTDDIALGFPDIVNLSKECRFSDCKHSQEPNCAVRKALEEGALPKWRWKSYQQIMGAAQ